VPVIKTPEDRPRTQNLRKTKDVMSHRRNTGRHHNRQKSGGLGVRYAGHSFSLILPLSLPGDHRVRFRLRLSLIRPYVSSSQNVPAIRGFESRSNRIDQETRVYPTPASVLAPRPLQVPGSNMPIRRRGRGRTVPVFTVRLQKIPPACRTMELDSFMPNTIANPIVAVSEYLDQSVRDMPVYTGKSGTPPTPM
jgi:hypothetical protein